MAHTSALTPSMESQVNDSHTSTTQFNPLLFAHNMSESVKVWQDILRIIAQEDGLGGLRHADRNLLNMAQEYGQWATKVMQDPQRLMQLTYVWMNDSANLWQNTMEQFLNGGVSSSVVTAPTIDDKRFADESWNNNIFFDYIKKQYLMTASWMNDSLHKLGHDADDAHTNDKVNFYTKQWVDAIAPSNFMITNPEVLKASLESNGETILKGLINLREDFERGKGRLAISTTDNNAFTIGVNIAATPGHVIFQNHLMQILHYTPRTEHVRPTPMLLIPAWINKFYIFDMQEKNSLVRWMLDEGYQVFVVSWVNPEAQHRDIAFADYVTLGVMKAMQVAREVTASEKVACVGYCLGGTLLATTLAYLHAKGEQEQVASATYLTTMLDFSDPGELGVFIDEEQIQGIEAKMDRTGYLEGADMAATFSLLRSNNMIWSFVVNNYLLGKEPFPFDLLYWNSDSTRMAQTMHSYCLRNFYLHNRLVQSGSLEVHGVAIDLSSIRTPSFFLSTREDHIAPWQSTFAATRHYGGDMCFVLAGSGHIAGVINPPTKNKYSYWTHPLDRTMKPEQWLSDATEHAGSWWGHWHEWQHPHVGAATKAVPSPLHGSYQPIEAAPGSYVRMR
ncbi:MAG: class I poly(R)-hydroxyalkanoic acid synthase [Alphaproteobacteria bacterium]|nr:MAG: class I poly(R)-hydroxyalkanoic acid synthase [Alphaproteobacteria bacterium]TAF15243.1 MAG: class I poly(R)-hydroxyalkanoic acid synthase [Alphaproteobacteria bacterium]TAF41063.1 MAG: class I poly(R)-hydroxyalkanoic acid synthase [Alphaproteobacteria bacterium]TAF76317.1 MAG: class I poly(R)-hydroxyalkanoic acid synthase [Alphaproteobacteria bacterium]